MTFEVTFFSSKQTGAVGRRFFLSPVEARAWVRKALEIGSPIYNCVIYAEKSLFEQWYWNGRQCVRLLEPWALSPREASRLHVDGCGRVKGIPYKLDAER
ncbi:hypothetical protein KKA53_05325 [Candidatus Dependentiae bacterium]|nr:hypothetical protein [Candidatus Dependentiae bacterium]